MTEKREINDGYDAALEYAAKKHEGQLRRGGEPYITHPVAVAEKLRRWGYGTDYRLAGLFHDLLEDTDAEEGEILALSNRRVLDAVKLLTNRRGYSAEEYVGKIRENEIAFAVKGADRLHNLESAFEADVEFRRRYAEDSRKWYMDFRPEIPKAVEEIEKTVKYKISEYRTEDFYVCWCSTDAVDTDCDMSLFSEYRKKRIKKLKKADAKRCSIAAELMLIHALGRCGPKASLPVRYDTDERGKPHFTDIKGIYFSLSHSGGMAACAVSDNPCGVDIQEIKQPNPKLAEKYFTVEERTQCAGCGFTRVWARKEAVSKADGRGIAAGFADFDTCGEAAVLDGKKYIIRDLPVSAGYAAAIAVKDVDMAGM